LLVVVLEDGEILFRVVKDMQIIFQLLPPQVAVQLLHHLILLLPNQHKLILEVVGLELVMDNLSVVLVLQEL
jgi:hypothetical protein